MKKETLPVKIRLPLLPRTEMLVGEIRQVDVLFYSKDNDLESPNFATVTERGIEWDIKPNGIIDIDAYGCIMAKNVGKARLTVSSTAVAGLSDTKIIEVRKTNRKGDGFRSPIVHFQEEPATPVQNLQKTVDHLSLREVDASDHIPPYIKRIVALGFSEVGQHKLVKQGDITWKIVGFADGSDAWYVIRTDHSNNDIHPRDKVQYFMGNRYLPGDGKSPKYIFDDGDMGIWVMGDPGVNPVLSHIQLEELSYTDKAIFMSDQTQKYVSRMGFASEASLINNVWTPKVSDNDGLWTSMYGAGELMRYAMTDDQEAKAYAKKIALRALKAVLMNAHIPGRTVQVDAKIRHLQNVVLGEGNMLSNEYLREGAPNGLDDYAGGPWSKLGYFGLNAGQTINGRYMGGTYRFSLDPLNPKDWITEGPAATTPRSLPGFIARSFVIPGKELYHHGGLWIHRNVNQSGGQRVLSDAELLYDFSKDQHPILPIGNHPIPKILEDVLTLHGVQYPVEAVAYKADTSTDEIIGHLFIYKIAFDVLTEREDREIKNLVVQTVKNLALHYSQNGYELVDATGQGTTWGKTVRNYFNSDFTMGDNCLNCLVVLCTYKLAFYMTGEQRWQDEYELLTKDPAFGYAELSGMYWDEWLWLGKNDDYVPDQGIYSLKNNPSEVEQNRHAMYLLNFSDQEMAMLAFYVLFQLEQDSHLLDQYRSAMEGWWQAIKQSENPFYYYVYQLAYPNERKKDTFGNDLVETASWVLSRHPVNMIETQAYFDGSRKDVLKDYNLSVDPQDIIGRRTSETDAKLSNIPSNFDLDPKFDPFNIYQIKVLPGDERSIHKFNNPTFGDIHASNLSDMEPSTTYTLSYWLGVYHGMLSS